MDSNPNPITNSSPPRVGPRSLVTPTGTVADPSSPTYNRDGISNG
jgi:hypothetical protein